MTERSPEMPSKSLAKRIIDWLRLVVGFIGLLLSAVWLGLTDNNLPHVLAVHQAASEPSQAPEWKVLMILLMAVSMIAVVGVWKFTTVDAGQLVAATWTGFWFLAFLGLLYVVQYSGPDAVCTYTNCWPSPYQELLVAAPVLAALIVMVILALTGRPSRALLRAAIPALVLLVLTAVQQLAWRNWVLPILLGPPPF